MLKLTLQAGKNFKLNVEATAWMLMLLIQLLA